jgi:hypothetical protein
MFSKLGVINDLKGSRALLDKALEVLAIQGATQILFIGDPFGPEPDQPLQIWRTIQSIGALVSPRLPQKSLAAVGDVLAHKLKELSHPQILPIDNGMRLGLLSYTQASPETAIALPNKAEEVNHLLAELQCHYIIASVDEVSPPIQWQEFCPVPPINQQNAMILGCIEPDFASVTYKILKAPLS